MRIWLRLVLAIIILFGVAFGIMYWLGTARWNSVTERMVEKLSEASRRRDAKTVSFRDLGRLPAPVARYFRMALTDGQPLIRSARVRHEGEFLVNPDERKWSPFSSTQHFSADPPGFVWDAAIHMSPLMTVRVRDAYVDGAGSMEARAAVLFPVVDLGGKAELNASALQRYLGEAVWFPTALLPAEGVAWSAIDGTRARATLTDSGTTVSLEFRFNKKGEITDITSPDRYREVGGKFVPTPWSVKLWNYEERDGMRIPLEGEVSWQLPEGRQSYWKGKIVDVRYDFVK